MSRGSAVERAKIKAVVSQVGPLDLDEITRGLAGPEQFVGFQQMTIQERIGQPQVK